jgi:hypothetical protein
VEKYVEAPRLIFFLPNTFHRIGIIAVKKNAAQRGGIRSTIPIGPLQKRATLSTDQSGSSALGGVTFEFTDLALFCSILFTLLICFIFVCCACTSCARNRGNIHLIFKSEFPVLFITRSRDNCHKSHRGDLDLF